MTGELKEDLQHLLASLAVKNAQEELKEAIRTLKKSSIHIPDTKEEVAALKDFLKFMFIEAHPEWINDANIKKTLGLLTKIESRVAQKSKSPKNTNK